MSIGYLTEFYRRSLIICDQNRFMCDGRVDSNWVRRHLYEVINSRITDNNSSRKGYGKIYDRRMGKNAQSPRIPPARFSNCQRKNVVTQKNWPHYLMYCRLISSKKPALSSSLMNRGSMKPLGFAVGKSGRVRASNCIIDLTTRT